MTCFSFHSEKEPQNTKNFLWHDRQLFSWGQQLMSPSPAAYLQMQARSGAGPQPSPPWDSCVSSQQ